MHPLRAPPTAPYEKDAGFEIGFQEHPVKADPAKWGIEKIWALSSQDSKTPSREQRTPNCR